MKKCEVADIVIKEFNDIKFGFDYDVLIKRFQDLKNVDKVVYRIKVYGFQDVTNIKII